MVPLPGKVSRVGVSSEDDEVVMSSSQQLGKPYKPAAVSSAASHVSHVVRTLQSRTSV